MSRFDILIFLLFWFPLNINAQQSIDDFESGNLDQWTIIQGNAEAQIATEYFGAWSARLWRRVAPAGAQSLMLHNTFLDNWGYYSVACYGEGPIVDIQLLFQYLNDQNYYLISSNPLGTDNPQLTLWKVIDGDTTRLETVESNVHLNTWFILKIGRFCDGRIQVFINDSLQIETMDRSIVDAGKIGLAAWGESAYFDEVQFNSSDLTEVTVFTEFLCSGRSYEFGGQRLVESGTYRDTLANQLGCDSFIQLDLSIVPHYLVTVRDTICAGGYVVFGSDTLRESGIYNLDLLSSHGCDSLVELRLQVIGPDPIRLDTTLCAGSILIWNQDTIRRQGLYSDTLALSDGCPEVRQLNVSIPDFPGFLGQDLEICFRDMPSIDINLNGFSQVEWPGGQAQGKLTLHAAGSYPVIAFRDNCPYRDTLVVTESCESTAALYIPNAFSPNGDQINDFFIPFFPTPPSQFLLRIYNRWGSLLFESPNPASGWDGRWQNQPEPPGVYLFFISADGSTFTGAVHLIR